MLFIDIFLNDLSYHFVLLVTECPNPSTLEIPDDIMTAWPNEDKVEYETEIM